MRIEVASSTPASAASGIFDTSGAAANTITASTAACDKDASREEAPLRTLTAVRAIAAVAGTPPNNGAAKFASPCPNSSLSGSCFCPTVIPSATVADSRDSSAARAATATMRREQRSERGHVEEGQRRRGQTGRQVTDRRRTPQPEHLHHNGGGDHRDDRERHRRPQPGTHEHHRGHTQREPDRRPVRDRHELDHGPPGDQQDLLALRLGHPERVGDLLEADHARDSEGEPLHHWQPARTACTARPAAAPGRSAGPRP